MSEQRYPLAWPSGWKRATSRKRANFSKQSRDPDYRYQKPLEIGDGLDRLTGELRRLGATSVVISTNLALNKDGTIRRDQRQPDDPGVAVYFKVNGRPRCMASDLWTSIPDNMAAIAGTIEALRMVDRYGVGSIDQAFAGYTALQPAAGVDWRIVLGVPEAMPLEQIEERYRKLAATAHPDVGGSDEAMTRLNMAMAAARKAHGHGSVTS